MILRYLGIYLICSGIACSLLILWAILRYRASKEVSNG